jgi:hypothetical protein
MTKAFLEEMGDEEDKADNGEPGHGQDNRDIVDNNQA